MNTIQNRIEESKLVLPINPRQDASDMIARAVARFESEGGVITKIKMGESNYRSTTQKSLDVKNRRKAGVHFSKELNNKCAK